MRRRFFNKINSLISFDYNDYLTIEALEDNVTVQFEKGLQYGIDGIGWTKLSPFSKILINSGQKLSFKATLSPIGGLGIGSFIIQGACNLKGNSMSLLLGDNAKNSNDLTGYSYAFYNLFRNQLGIKCVSNNFLPATTLASSCYSDMFYGCTSLVNAPELPATTLVSNCYRNMFYGCSNLNYIKMLATDISGSQCLYQWVYNVPSTGTFIKSKDATWDVRGVSGIPSNWKIEYDHNYDIGSDISFHIERIDEKLYAKDWMTWDDWVHSKYNTVSARIVSSEILIPSYSSYPLDTYPNNIIKNGGTYYFENTGGGSSD